MGFLQESGSSEASAEKMDAESSSPGDQNSGCGKRFAACILLLFCLFVIVIGGNGIPGGFDEATAGVVVAWCVRALFGIDVTNILNKTKSGGAQEK